jgi:glycine betaine/proline transport system substrate-binding protein
MTRRKNCLDGCLISAALAMILASTASISASGQGKGVVKLAEGDWTGNLTQVHLARIILEEHMGYEVDLTYADYNAQWVSIASGDLHIAMEQWQESTIPQMEKFLTEFGGNGEIAFLGDTGVIGETGYYVPTYVIEGDPERGIEPLCPQLKDWRQLNECASVFATLETAPKGRWLGCPSVGWGCEDEKRVMNLELDFVSVAIGSEAAHWAEIEGAYSRGEAIIFDGWTPHWSNAKYDLTRVDLPDATPECWGLVEGVEPTYACDFFRGQITYNIANPVFVKDYPEVAQFITNMHLTNDQQAGMLLAVDVEGRDVTEVVREWMAANEDTWKGWIP